MREGLLDSSRGRAKVLLLWVLGVHRYSGKADSNAVLKVSIVVPLPLEHETIWVRIFVQHEGVQLGRISMEPTAGGHAVNSVKFYKKSDYEFEPRDRFFYLIHAWLDTGKVPDVDFDALVAQAKQNKAEFVASQTAWREANPIFKTEIDEDGEPHTVQKKRRRLDRSWMGEFRKLTEAAI